VTAGVESDALQPTPEYGIPSELAVEQSPTLADVGPPILMSDRCGSKLGKERGFTAPWKNRSIQSQSRMVGSKKGMQMSLREHSVRIGCVSPRQSRPKTLSTLALAIHALIPLVLAATSLTVTGKSHRVLQRDPRSCTPGWRMRRWMLPESVEVLDAIGLERQASELACGWPRPLCSVG
jgi:hypothetical protein